MARFDAASLYSDQDGPPAQGDILLGAVARVIADDGFCPPRWQLLDEFTAELAGARDPFPALRVAGGRGLVMVTTHDCGLDKEFNASLDRLEIDVDLDAGTVETGLEGAIAQAEDDPTLDRSFLVSPLVAPETVEVAGEIVDQGLLMAGRVVGYLPVPPLVVEGFELVPASVVDLSYRTTLDRFAYVRRLTSISEAGREQLRYALARLDVLRTPTLESQLAAAVGQRIQSARVSKQNPLMVTLVLADGSKLELLRRPASPTADPPSRSRRSVR
ncbi:MAG: hypothetical protein ACYCST_18520 [Acidimicrobiales bacterium]